MRRKSQKKALKAQVHSIARLTARRKVKEDSIEIWKRLFRKDLGSSASFIKKLHLKRWIKKTKMILMEATQKKKKGKPSKELWKAKNTSIKSTNTKKIRKRLLK